MAFFLSHITAADFWRLVYDPSRVPGPAETAVPFELEPCHYQDFKRIAPRWIGEPLTVPENGKLHLMVPDAAIRPRWKNAQCHLWQRPLPEDAFYR